MNQRWLMISILEQTFVEEAARVLSENGRVIDATDADYLTAAAKLLGMLITENRCSLEEIVNAARATWDHERSGQYTDDSRFFRAIARESLGHGKVFDEFAEFRVPSTGTCRCGEERDSVLHAIEKYPGAHTFVDQGRLFSVPRLALTGGRL